MQQQMKASDLGAEFSEGGKLAGISVDSAGVWEAVCMAVQNTGFAAKGYKSTRPCRSATLSPSAGK